MPVFYNKVEKSNPAKPGEAKKWYAILKSSMQVGEKEVAKLISDETTINHKEVEMALAQFEKILLRLLLNGFTVQLGDWGSFRLTCNSAGSDNEKDVTAANIKNLNIRFSAGKNLKKTIQKATFMPAEAMLSKKK